MGNSCYINSSLQMLYSVPGFASALEYFREGRALVSSICDLSKELQDKEKVGSASAKAIKTVVDANTHKFRGYQQRDAHEFLGDLIDQIHEELERASDKNTIVQGVHQKDEGLKADEELVHSNSDTSNGPMLPTDGYFRLDVEVCLKCQSCGYRR